VSQAQSDAGRHAGGPLASLGAGAWRSLAAAPTFAVMALLTGIPGGGAMAGMVCSPARELLRWDGMAAMYLLMSAFHLPPWLKLVARSAAHAP
jgi:hypothetical protein